MACIFSGRQPNYCIIRWQRQCLRVCMLLVFMSLKISSLLLEFKTGEKNHTPPYFPCIFSQLLSLSMALIWYLTMCNIYEIHPAKSFLITFNTLTTGMPLTSKPLKMCLFLRICFVQRLGKIFKFFYFLLTQFNRNIKDHLVVSYIQK